MAVANGGEVGGSDLGGGKGLMLEVAAGVTPIPPPLSRLHAKGLMLEVEAGVT